MLFQGSALFDSLPVWENITFRLLQQGMMTRDQAKMLAVEKLQSVGLSPAVADIWPAELSGGMQRRGALARAIATDPKIIFFDEPTAGLDPNAIDEFHNLVRDLAGAGKTVLMVTHDVYGACQVADRIGLLHTGNLVSEFSAPKNGQIDTKEVHRAFSTNPACSISSTLLSEAPT